MQYGRKLVGVALLLTCIASLGADDNPDVHSAIARSALEKRDAIVKKAASEYLEKLAAADQHLATDLDKALQQALRDGSLKEANSLDALKKDAVARVSNEKPESSSSPMSLIGRWRIRTRSQVATWIISGDKVHVIHDNGDADAGPAAQSNGLVVVKYPNGWIERFSPLGDRIVFESWEPKVSNGFPTVESTEFGIGTRILEK
jgi:hypothetical protein